MKRLFSVVLGSIILMVSVFNFPACAVTECEHRDVPVYCQDSHSGCHSGLYRWGFCSDCGEEVYEVLESKHTWQYEITKEPDCKNSGYIRYKCAYCEQTNDIKLSPLGHDGVLEDTYTNPISTKNSCHSLTKSYTCSRCGEWYDETEYVYEHTAQYMYIPGEPKCLGQYRCSFCDYVDEEKTKQAQESHHNWVTQKEENCWEHTERVYCTLCYTEKSFTYLPVEHDWKITVVSEPSCEIEGYYIYTCSKCGCEEYDWESETHQKGELIRTVSPSCDSVGYNVYSCSLCGKEFKADYGEKNQHIEPHYLDSEYVSFDCSAGIQHNYRCDYCGDYYSIIEETTGHDWQVDHVIPKVTCDESEITLYRCGNSGCYEEKYVVTEEPTEHNWTEHEEPIGSCSYRKIKSCVTCGIYLEVGTPYQKCNYKTTVYKECGKIGYTYMECLEDYSNEHDIVIFNNGHTFENKRIYDKASKRYIYRDVCTSCNMHNGDLNEDGKVNVLDLVKMKKELANLSNNNIFDNRDCTQDGLLNALDLIYLINVLIN